MLAHKSLELFSPNYCEAQCFSFFIFQLNSAYNIKFTFIVGLDVCLAGFALLIILSIAIYNHHSPLFCVENWISKIAISVSTVYVNEYEIKSSALKLCVILERLLLLHSPTSSNCTIPDCMSLPVRRDLKTLLRYPASRCVRITQSPGPLV